MALELLAGPFPVVAGDGSTPIDISEAQFYGSAIYDDAIGLASSGGGSYCITQWDGITYARADGLFGSGTRTDGIFVLDLQSFNGAWLVIEPPDGSKLYAFDRRTGGLGALVIDGVTTNSVVAIHARAKDRFLYFNNATVQARPLDLSTAFATECTLAGAGSGRAVPSLTKHPNIICLTWTDGKVLYYDFVAKVQIAGSAFVGANNGAWYSARHDVFVVLTGGATNYVSIYANAVLPTAISNPVASPTLAKGRVSTISVTLTGANGDPCVGELVDWTKSGPGSLLATQSETNASGVASVGYVAPMTLSSNPTFTATVTL